MKELVPLAQTLAWIGLIVGGLVAFRRQLVRLLDAVEKRIESGAEFKAGPLELGEDLRRLERVQSASDSTTAASQSIDSRSDWNSERDGIYSTNRGFFLAHVLEPSEDPEQLYDIYIYLIRHKSDDFSEIAFAEFFFGKYWSDQVFREEVHDGRIGVATAAYGPFLCTCRVHFRDGTQVLLHRYIDFEMRRLLHRRM
jgi:hypothetical protein